MSFSRVEASEKDHIKCLVVKENTHRMLVDLKQMQKFSFTSVIDSLHGLLKKKHSNGISFFDQFDKSCCNGMRNCWLSSELGAGIPRTNNSLERYNCHVKNNFTENLLLPVNESLVTFTA